MHSSPKRDSSILYALLIFLILVKLYFGLRPFNFFEPNRIEFTDTGLQFRPHGIAFTTWAVTDPDASGFTLEIEFTPLTFPETSLPQILCFTDHRGNEILSLGQWKKSIVIWQYKSGRSKQIISEVPIGSAAVPEKTTLLTLISECSHGTVFLDGKQIVESPLLADLSRIIINGTTMVAGNNAAGTAPWNGVIRSLSLFGSTPPISSAKSYCDHSTSTPLHQEKMISPLLHYDFTRYGSSYIKNLKNLETPERFSVVRRDFLVPFWEDFIFSRAYLKDIFVNFLGFIPFGAVSFFFFISVQKKRAFAALLMSTMLAFSLSLFIETLQISLPTRYSQLSDLLLNTFGAFCGAVIGYIRGHIR